MDAAGVRGPLLPGQREPARRFLTAGRGDHARGARRRCVLLAAMPGAHGVPLQEDHLRGDHPDPLHPQLHLPHAELPHPRPDRLARHDLGTRRPAPVPSACSRQFFIGLPKELEESARLDGAGPSARGGRSSCPTPVRPSSRWPCSAFWRTGTTSSGRSTSLFERLTPPAGLSRLQGAYTIDYPVVMAGAMLAAIPVLALYVFVQRYVIEGAVVAAPLG